jgi:Kef-type K+ transport system membrane component KefB
VRLPGPVAGAVDVLAGFGGVLLTFLAGAEIDPGSLRRFLVPSLAIGGVGFRAPFAGAVVGVGVSLLLPGRGSRTLRAWLVPGRR